MREGGTTVSTSRCSPKGPPGSSRRRRCPADARSAVTAPGDALSARESITRKEKIMRVFVTGASGALGRHLVPGLVAAGHEVTATTKTPAKVTQLSEAGAVPVVL